MIGDVFQQMPSEWIFLEGNMVARMSWVKGGGSDQTAGLMVYIALLHAINGVKDHEHFGRCQITYDGLNDMTSLSRSKISAGLKVLESYGHIRKEAKRGAVSNYYITGYGNGKWGKIPVRGMYEQGRNKISIFENFTLRSKVELNSLRLYLLFIAMRDIKTGYASVSYDKIIERIKIHRNEIRPAVALLVTYGLVYVDKNTWDGNKFYHNRYEIRHVGRYIKGSASA